MIWTPLRLLLALLALLQHAESASIDPESCFTITPFDVFEETAPQVSAHFRPREAAILDDWTNNLSPLNDVCSKLELIPELKVGRATTARGAAAKWSFILTYASAAKTNLKGALSTFSNDPSTASTSSTSSAADGECKFVSFEEWKKLKQAEQKNDNTFTGTVTAAESSEVSSIESVSTSESQNLPESSTAEDQGKTYKGKFNFASVSCGATVIKTNSDAKGASAILTEIKDSYLINKCSSSSMFIVIELCQDILVNAVKIGNYEMFSSMFRDLKFLVSGTFPPTNGWRELGQFEAQNILDLQSFKIKNPLIWARYLKIEILSHYGNEFYCPISIVRVHGTTMMDEDKNSDRTKDYEPSQQLSLDLIDNIEPEECKARLPHLVLSDFLTELNSTKDYCDSRASNLTAAMGDTTSITTQESIFQNIIKRLSLLESNSTLSLLYFEEQSKLLSETFRGLEKRQKKRFESFAHRVNASMHTQSLVLGQQIRQEMRRMFEMFEKRTVVTASATNEKILILARELSVQRKIIFIDTFLLLALVAYIIMTWDTKLEEHKVRKHQPMQFAVGPRKAKYKRTRR